MPSTTQHWLWQTLQEQGLSGSWPPGETIRGWCAEADALLQREATAQPTLHLLDPIAQGGMGWIRRAMQEGLEREVAVKSLLPGEQRPWVVSALLREARLTGRLEHPNIVPVHALSSSEEEGPLMVMKRIEGASWAALIAEPGRLGWQDGELDVLERHLEVLMALCQAVHFAHRQGIVHRDIKPDNVMVGEFGEIYLLDWGVACELGSEETERKFLQGTPVYMAPEMVQQGAPITPQTDIFLLGASLHEVLTGQPRNHGESLLEVLDRAKAAAPARYPPAVPEELAAICNRACAAAPADRYPDAMALRSAIVEFLRHRSSVAASEAARRQLAHLRALVTGEETAADGAAVDGAAADLTLQVHRSYSACRFGFEQALREWGDNRSASAGLQSTLELMIRFVLAEGNHRSAARLIAALPEPRPDLSRQAEAIAEAAAEQTAAAARLAELQRQSRFRGTDWGRSLVTVLNGTASAAVLLVLAAVMPGLHVQQAHALLFVSLSGAAIVIGIIPFRAYLLDNRLYSRLMVIQVMLCPLLAFSHGLGWLLSLPFVPSLIADCLIACAINFTLAVAVDRAFWVSSAIAAVTTLLVALHLEQAIALIAVAYALNCYYLAWMVRPRAGTTGAALMGSPGP